MTETQKAIEDIELEASKYADRIIALGYRDNPVKEDISSDWEAGYIFGKIDGMKAAGRSKSLEEKEKEIERLKGIIDKAWIDGYMNGAGAEGSIHNQKKFKTENNLL